MTVLVDPDLTADRLLETLYAGHLVVLTSLPGVRSLVERTRAELGALFAPVDPQVAHEQVTKAEMARILGEWKPRFIHSPWSQQLVREIVQQAGLPPEGTHYDLPRPRTSFPVGHLTTGIAYAFPWHRDVWYSAPVQQINWWLPIYPVRDDNSLSFDPEHFSRPVANSSSGFDYYDNNRARATTAQQIDRETQARPAAVDFEPHQELIVLPKPGAVLLFSGAHLHRSIPNVSGRARYSVDFRTVDVADLVAGRGAELIDTACSGTSIRDFRRVADDEPFDEDLVVRLFGAPPSDSTLVFPSPSATPAPATGALSGRTPLPA